MTEGNLIKAIAIQHRNTGVDISVSGVPLRLFKVFGVFDDSLIRRVVIKTGASRALVCEREIIFRWD